MLCRLRTARCLAIASFVFAVNQAGAGPIGDAVERHATHNPITSTQQSAPVRVPAQYRPTRGGSLKVAMISAAAGCGFGAFIGPVAAEQNASVARANGCVVGAAIFGGLGFLLSMR